MAGGALQAARAEASTAVTIALRREEEIQAVREEVERHRNTVCRLRKDVDRLREMTTTAQKHAEAWERLCGMHGEALSDANAAHAREETAATKYERQLRAVAEGLGMQPDFSGRVEDILETPDGLGRVVLRVAQEHRDVWAALRAVALLVGYGPAQDEAVDLAEFIEHMRAHLARLERENEVEAAALAVCEEFAGPPPDGHPRTLVPFIRQHLEIMRAERDSLVRIACALGWRTNIREVDPERVEGLVHRALEALETFPVVRRRPRAWPAEPEVVCASRHSPALSQWVDEKLLPVLKHSDRNGEPPLRPLKAHRGETRP